MLDLWGNEEPSKWSVQLIILHGRFPSSSEVKHATVMGTFYIIGIPSCHWLSTASDFNAWGWGPTFRRKLFGAQNDFQFKKQSAGAGELVQKLQALTAIPKVQSSIPSIHAGWLTTICTSNSRRLQCLWPKGTCIRVHMLTYTLPKVIKRNIFKMLCFNMVYYITF